MIYSAQDEARYQAMQKIRETLVRELRIALEKAGVRESVATPNVNTQEIKVLLSPPGPTTKVYDIESVIKNASAIRAALEPFDRTVPQADEKSEAGFTNFGNRP